MANRCTPLVNIEALAAGSISSATYFDNNMANAPNALNDSSLGYVNGIPTDTGSANNYIVTLPFGTPSAYQQGMTVAFIPSATNTGASTLTVTPLASQNIVDQAGVAVVASAIQVGVMVLVVHDGTNFRVVTPTPGSLGPLLAGYAYYSGSLATSASLTNVTNWTQTNASGLAITLASSTTFTPPGVSIMQCQVTTPVDRNEYQFIVNATSGFATGGVYIPIPANLLSSPSRIYSIAGFAARPGLTPSFTIQGQVASGFGGTCNLSMGIYSFLLL